MHLWAEFTAAFWTLEPFGEIGANISLQLLSRTRFDKINKKKVIAENQCEKHKKSNLELEKLKLESEQRDENREATQRNKDKKMEMEKLKIEAEVELKKIEAKTTSHPWWSKEKSSNPRGPKLPYFDEQRDKMDSYLTRFERYAISNKWDLSMLASYLSALLKGPALKSWLDFPKMDSWFIVR